MARQKVKLAFIVNAAARKATYKKRSKSILKKVDELCTLCGIEACAIIYGPYEQEPEIWPPSPLEVQRVVSKFKAKPEFEQTKKKLNHEDYLRQRIVKSEDQLNKLRRENRQNMMQVFTYEYFKTGQVVLDNFAMNDLNDLSWFVDQNLKTIGRRLEAGHADNGQGQIMPPPPAAASSSSNGEMAMLMNHGHGQIMPPPPPPAVATTFGNGEMAMLMSYGHGQIMTPPAAATSGNGEMAMLMSHGHGQIMPPPPPPAVTFGNGEMTMLMSRAHVGMTVNNDEIMQGGSFMAPTPSQLQLHQTPPPPAAAAATSSHVGITVNNDEMIMQGMSFMDLLNGINGDEAIPSGQRHDANL